MYLANATMSEIVKKQYFYKLHVHIGAFTSLMIVQLLALVFSLSGSGMMGSSSEGISISLQYYNGNIILAFSMIWAFMSGIAMTTKQMRKSDFAFVANPLSNHFSTIFFLLTMSIVGGLTVLFASGLLQVMISYFIQVDAIVNPSFHLSFSEFLIGFITTACYLLLLSALGYAAGMLVQLSRIFVVLLPALVIGMIILEARLEHRVPFDSFITFFSTETSAVLFVGKAFLTAVLLFLFAILTSNRLEVPR